LNLHISKRQSKGWLGGVKLEITYRVELTDKEKNLLKKYKAEKDILKEGCYSTVGYQHYKISVSMLIKEKEIISKHSKIESLIEEEEVINRSYIALKEKIEALKKFEEDTSSMEALGSGV
jgi:hypothetical protein